MGASQVDASHPPVYWLSCLVGAITSSSLGCVLMEVVPAEVTIFCFGCLTFTGSSLYRSGSIRSLRFTIEVGFSTGTKVSVFCLVHLSRLRLVSRAHLIPSHYGRKSLSAAAYSVPELELPSTRSFSRDSPQDARTLLALIDAERALSNTFRVPIAYLSATVFF